VKKLAKIAETGLGSYISLAIMGFPVGALHRQRDDFNFFTASQPFSVQTFSVITPEWLRLHFTIVFFTYIDYLLPICLFQY